MVDLSCDISFIMEGGKYVIGIEGSANKVGIGKPIATKALLTFKATS